jgi:hypothetical protein
MNTVKTMKHKSLGGNRWECILCGYECSCATDMTYRSCTKCTKQPEIKIVERVELKEVRSGPNMARKIFNFGLAVVNHVVDGMHHRTKEEIESILTEHCYKCPLYNAVDKRCMHESCGCPITGSKKFFNKISWKSQHCPLKLW